MFYDWRMNTASIGSDSDIKTRHIELDLELFAHSDPKKLSEDDLGRIFELSSSDENV